jgi:hypothetical protein
MSNHDDHGGAGDKVHEDRLANRPTTTAEDLVDTFVTSYPSIKVRITVHGGRSVYGECTGLDMDNEQGQHCTSCRGLQHCLSICHECLGAFACQSISVTVRHRACRCVCMRACRFGTFAHVRFNMPACRHACVHSSLVPPCMAVATCLTALLPISLSV